MKIIFVSVLAIVVFLGWQTYRECATGESRAEVAFCSLVLGALGLTN
ncbi:hypothetical protein [Leisingera sp. ANG59]|nr:hypothetical protein [Leisingera sp. ANG59]NSY39069.1 hypothetical protein [Leisingera sp. ANG59]